jgi:hypothetical protein
MEQRIVEPCGSSRFDRPAGDPEVRREEDTWVLFEQLDEFVVYFFIPGPDG